MNNTPTKKKMASDEEQNVGVWKDVLGSGAVMVQTLRPAPKQNLSVGAPEYKQEVLVHIIGRETNTGRVFLDTRAVGQNPISAYVGEPIMDSLPPGVMLCLRQMHVGEICHIKLHSKYAYALGGQWYGLKPETDCEFEVELLQIGDFLKEVPEQTPEELKKTMREFKTRGNEFFKWDELNKALRCYKEGVRYGDGLFGDQGAGFEEQEFDQEAYKDRVACISNIAAVLEKQGQLSEAMESTVLALTADPSHLKSLARATRIAVAQGSHEEAKAALQVALDLAPQNQAILKLQRELNEKITQHAALERQRYGGFLKPVAKDVAEKLRQKQQAEQIQFDQLEQAAKRLQAAQKLAPNELEEESTPADRLLLQKEEEEEAEEEEDSSSNEMTTAPVATSSSFENSLVWKSFVLLFPSLFVLLAVLIPRIMANL